MISVCEITYSCDSKCSVGDLKRVSWYSCQNPKKMILYHVMFDLRVNVYINIKHRVRDTNDFRM